MRQMTRWGSAALVGAAMTLGACGGREEGQATSYGTDSATAAGEVAAGGAAGSMGAMGDSGAMAGGSTMPSASGAMTNMSEPDIMGMIGVSNAGEIGTSKAALPRLTDKEARTYARRMIDEHQTMQGMADKLATTLNVTPGTPPMALAKKDTANRIAQQFGTSAKGTGLDRQYIDGQVQMHQQTLTELQAMQGTSNAELKTLITGAIPKVQAHLTEAQRLQGKLSRPGATPGATSGATSGGTSTP